MTGLLKLAPDLPEIPADRQGFFAPLPESSFDCTLKRP